MQVIFNSQLNCTNAVACGVPVGNSHVIHSGIDTQKFTFKPRTKFGSPLTLIVPGRIEPRKGQLDAVMLLAELREQGLDSKLIFVGQKWANSYYSELEEEIKKQNLEKSVEFFSMMTQDELVGMYYQADICFFPSYQQVGYSRTPLEAMACGCILFSYGNEGSDEIISDTRTGFLVSPAEFRAIANIIKELTSNPITVRKITESAGKVIEVNCSMVSYIDSIEKILISRVGSP
jgi:glycosyltransferase involved in cell wall biosynthesis